VLTDEPYHARSVRATVNQRPKAILRAQGLCRATADGCVVPGIGDLAGPDRR
jgi:hypothetical protein